MKSSQKKTVYAFIDSQNLNVGVQKFGWKMDWVKFRKYLEQKYGVNKAFMFIGYVPEFEDMYEQLHQAGYMIVLKPTYDMTRPRPESEESGERREERGEDDKNGENKKAEEEKKPVKGNVDADLVLWVMKEIPHYSKAIIVSGDGDFYSLVEYLDKENKLSKILAPNGHYSRLFNRYEKYIDRLDKARGELAYHDKRRRNQPRRETAK